MIQENSRVLARYSPQIRNKKWFTKVCDGRDNGGIHDLRQFKKLIAMLEHAAHNWRNARLYHIILTGADRATYSQVMNKFCRQLRAAGVQCDFKAAIEQSSKRGLHQHVMLVMSTDKRPSQYITAADESGVVKASLLRRVVRQVQAECSTLACCVQPPASRPVAYIELNQTNNEFLNEAVEWASYILKARSKLPESAGRCYTSSRPARRACSKVGGIVLPRAPVSSDREAPVCWAASSVKETNFKNIRFPTTAHGQKLGKTPINAGIPHLKAISPTILRHKTYSKQHEMIGKSHFIDCFGSRGEWVYNGVTVVRQSYTNQLRGTPQ